MKLLARIVMLSLFAALGVAMAVYVGIHADELVKIGRDSPSPATKSPPGKSAGHPATETARQKSTWKLGASPIPDRQIPDSAKPRCLPPPPGPLLAAPAPAYAREVVPPPQGQALPKVLKLLKGPLGRANPAASAGATSGRVPAVEKSPGSFRRQGRQTPHPHPRRRHPQGARPVERAGQSEHPGQ